MRRAKIAAAIAIILGGAAFFWLSAPRPVSAPRSFDQPGDPVAGERWFLIGGCASCHSAPGAEGDARLVLSGGRALASPFGTFHSPNISPDPEQGIGRWTAADLATAMLDGLSPDGQHYYPAFPYTSYARMEPAHINDLFAYLQTLPASPAASKPHQLPWPFRLRRGIGLWKRLYLDPAPVAEVSAEAEAGRYLVEGPGHCGECHTPRDVFGGPELDRWLQGAPNPGREGRIPSIKSGSSGAGTWSAGDIAYYLETGFTPDFDSAGGDMVEVIANTARLPAADREAIALYLKSLVNPD